MDIAVNDQTARPKTAEGTADWETIFEHPESGLIPLVASARSLDGLKACAGLVINQLFTRKNDAAERERLQGILGKVVARAEGGGGVAEARERVLLILRAIKQERLRKAAAYVAQKRQKSGAAAAAERRRAGGAFIGDVHHLFGARKPLFALLGALMAGVAALLVAALFIGDDGAVAPKPAETDPATTAASSAPSAPKSEPAVEAVAEPHSSKPAPAESGAEASKPKSPAAAKSKPNGKPAKPEYPKSIYFKPMYWVLKNTNMRRGYTYYQAVISVTDKSAYSTVCTRLPSVQDAFNLALSRTHPETGSADARELARAGAWAAERLNGKFGKGTIARVDFLRDGDPTFSPSAVPCR